VPVKTVAPRPFTGPAQHSPDGGRRLHAWHRPVPPYAALHDGHHRRRRKPDRRTRRYSLEFQPLTSGDPPHHVRVNDAERYCSPRAGLTDRTTARTLASSRCKQRKHLGASTHGPSQHNLRRPTAPVPRLFLLLFIPLLIKRFLQTFAAAPPFRPISFTFPYTQLPPLSAVCRRARPHALAPPPAAGPATRCTAVRLRVIDRATLLCRFPAHTLVPHVTRSFPPGAPTP